ncbi:MAG: 6-bladed beta-propeller [Acidobacteria bacterium]|nr:6-bladed beta-propeller [Acidobacteriota bacterium]
MTKKQVTLWIFLTLTVCIGLTVFALISFARTSTKNAKFWGTEVYELGKNETDHEMFYGVSNVFSDEDANIYVVDQGNHRVQVFNRKGKFLRTIGREGQGPGEFMMPIAGGCFRDKVFVADEKTQRILVFDRKNGTHLYDFKLSGTPSDFCITRSGDLLVGYMSSNGKIIHRYSTNGDYMYSFGALDNKYKMLMYFNKICTLSLDKEENLYVSYNYVNLIQKYDRGGQLVGETGTNFHFDDKAGVHANGSGGFHARSMFWSSFYCDGSIYLVTACSGPISTIFKLNNYTIIVSADFKTQKVIRNPFPVLCGSVLTDGRLALCDSDFVLHVFRR